MEQLKHIKEAIVNRIADQVNGNLDIVNTKELGEAIDMVKDLAKAIYYCTVTEAMDEKSQEEQYEKYNRAQMYYDGRSSSGMNMPVPASRSGMEGRRAYQEIKQPYPMITDGRDYREGRSPIYRKMYMEAKSAQDKTKSMQELDNYMQELTSDLVDMVHDATPEEKQMLQQKISVLASKIK